MGLAAWLHYLSFSLSSERGLSIGFAPSEGGSGLSTLARIVHQNINTIRPSAKTISAINAHMLKLPQLFRSSFISSKLHSPGLLLSLLPSLLPSVLLLSLTACSTTTPLPVSECKCAKPGISAPAPAIPAPVTQGPQATPSPPLSQPAWAESTFRQIPAWETHGHLAYLEAFTKQCSNKGTDYLSRSKSTPSGLVEACQKTRTFLEASAVDNTKAKQFIEGNFDAWQFQKEDGGKEGLLTGYFEPLLKGSRVQTGPYIAPLWGVPKDLITVELAGLFPELEGKRVRGRIVGNKLVPYHDRQSWENTASKKETPLVWIDNKLDAFLLQVQGSGRVQLPNGDMMRLSYADQNGHPYKAIGRVLVQRGELTTEQATIPGIAAWAEKNPQALDELLNANPSVVFFTENKKLNPNEGPVGALGLPLTPELSLAVDRKRIAYGSMIWVETTHPSTGQSIRKGMLAQDTGGAISGRVRGDFYWGSGRQAGQWAGLMRQPLKMWLLWPKGVPLPKMD